MADLKLLGERLQNGDVDQAFLRQLEELARKLEQKRVDIVRQMRGSLMFERTLDRVV